MGILSVHLPGLPGVTQDLQKKPAAGLRWHFLGKNGQKPVAKHLSCVCCEAEEEELKQQSVY